MTQTLSAKMNIAIVDAGANLKAFARMDGAWRGIPIKNGAGVVIGAIGVSGSTVENDHIVAEAGLKAL